MSDITHQTSSIGWQARQLLSRVNQAIEYRFSQTDVDLPDWEWPDWLRFDFPEIVGQIIFWFVISALTLWLAWLLYLSLEPMVTECQARWEQDSGGGRAERFVLDANGSGAGGAR